MGCARHTTSETIPQPVRAAGECEAMAITLAMAQALARMHVLEDQDGGEIAARTKSDQEEQQLNALSNYLGRRLEWTRAKSLAGVCGQLLQMRELAYELHWKDEGQMEAEETLRRFSRLHRLALQAILEIGGLDPTIVGADYVLSGGHGDAHEGALALLVG